MPQGVPQDQDAATCTVLEQQLQGSPRTSGWSCLVGAEGAPGATVGAWGGVVSGTCPQLLLSAGKNCPETTSCHITQSQSQGTLGWALIFALPKALRFPELTADTTHLASPSTSKQAEKREERLGCYGESVAAV